jgi:hypothetical protein
VRNYDSVCVICYKQGLLSTKLDNKEREYEAPPDKPLGKSEKFRKYVRSSLYTESL